MNFVKVKENQQAEVAAVGSSAFHEKVFGVERTRQDVVDNHRLRTISALLERRTFVESVRQNIGFVLGSSTNNLEKFQNQPVE